MKQPGMDYDLGKFTTYCKKVGNALGFKHFAPGGAGRTTLAAGMARVWVEQDRTGALVVPLASMECFYANAFELPLALGYCFGGLSALRQKAHHYRSLAIDDCEKFSTSEGDPVELALSALSGQEGAARVVHGFYRAEHGEVVELGPEWERVPQEENPLLNVVPCKWPEYTLPAEWFEGDFGGTEGALKSLRLERVRQVSAEGWPPAHDDRHDHGELMGASIGYVLAAVFQSAGLEAPRIAPECWPWSQAWWKPQGGPRRNPVKAGALILAELERMDRAEGGKRDAR